jgi:hypothetical protein
MYLYCNNFAIIMAVEIKLDKQRETKKGFSIIIHINLNGKRKNIASKYYTFLKDWNEDKIEPKKTHPQYLELLSYLVELKYKINQIGNIKKYFSVNKIVSDLFTNNSDDFMSFWKDLINDHKKNGLKKAKNYEEVYNIVSKYQQVIPFEELNYSFLIKFRDFKLSNGCTANGIHSYLRTFRTIYNESIRREMFTPNQFTSPFKGVLPTLIATKDKFFTISEMKIISSNITEDNNVLIKGFNTSEITKNRRYHYHNYFMLCFLLGGIDFIDLANLRYDLHVKNGRIKFERFKGGTTERIDNLIPSKALEILALYKNESLFLINVDLKNYESLRNNYQRRFGKWLKSIGIDSYFGTKTPRYTFIDIGKQLLLNRDVIMELTGHKRGDVHSVYEGKFPYNIKDHVHQQIIDSIKLDN